MNYIKKLSSKEIYKEQETKGVVEYWDFSRANTNADARIEAITTVASVCYNSPKIQGSLRVFNMLEAESLGLPSTSFEYVPILLPYRLLNDIRSEVMSKNNKPILLNMVRFGEFVKDETNIDSIEDDWFLLTNLRAVLYDNKKYDIKTVDFKNYFNSSEKEIDIINQNTKTFFTKIPIFVARQLVRHRLQLLQELSRRYTSDKSLPIEFYAKNNNIFIKGLNKIALLGYKILMKMGFKSQDARGVLGTNMYTQLWSGWGNVGYDNFIKLRTKKKAQEEIISLATACELLINNPKSKSIFDELD